MPTVPDSNPLYDHRGAYDVHTKSTLPKTPAKNPQDQKYIPQTEVEQLLRTALVPERVPQSVLLDPTPTQLAMVPEPHYTEYDLGEQEPETYQPASRYEYVFISTTTPLVNVPGLGLISHLNQRGDAGWEAVGFRPDGQLLMKRILF